MTFNDILELIDELPLDHQKEIVRIVKCRIAASEREELLKNVEEAQREYLEGKLKPMTVEEIMEEAMS